ncbi:DNA translocase FtsK [Bacillus sp. AK031]
MSWFKKVFGRSKEENVHSEEPLYKEEKLIDKKTEKNKEIEARISYQYPKGEFRFPVIPDRRDVHREERQSRSEQRRQRREHSRYEGRKAEHEEKVQEDIKKREKAPEREEAFKRPFRPTEIPSPIYGFSKQAQQEPVQYELKSTERKRWGQEQGEIPVTDEVQTEQETVRIKESHELSGESEVVNEPAPVLAESSYEAPLLQETVEVQEHTERADYSEPLSDSVRNPNEIQTSTEKENAEPAQEADSLTTSAEPEFTPKEDELEVETIEETEDEEISNSFAIDEQQAEEAGETEEGDAQAGSSNRSHLPFNVLMLKQDKRNLERKRFTETAMGTIQASQETEEKASVEETAVTACEAEPAPVELQEEPAVQESSMNTSEDTNEIEKSTEPDNREPVNDLSEESQEPVKSSSRSHLPFNVLMLKQDKRKMNHSNPDPNAAAAQPAKNEQAQADDNASLKNYEALSEQKDQYEGYTFPQVNFLAPPVMKESSGEWLEIQQNLLNDTLANFNVRASVVNVTEGPSVTRFEVQPEPGVKVNKITNLSDDIKLSLAARDIRIEAPIPGKHTIGIEVPNKQSRPVSLSEIISSSPFQDSSSPLTAALGLDISGEPIVTDLNKMPHGLIAGATGSGKSVCINSILISLLYKASPQDLKLLLIDPKMVELAPYNRMPHLVSPVITDVKAATAALKWAVEEMERRYELFAHTGVRDISRYNLKAERSGDKNQKLPYLVIVIDELADLMMMSPADVEEAICRIAQKARACGIHLIIATQRPSVDVITGLIKANVPTRIAFSVSSGVDSRTIIDSSGAEKLLGKGDMLFLENGSSKPVRLQGTFVSDDEIDDIVNHVREQGEPNYLFQQDELLKKAQVDDQEDELFLEACEFVVEQGGASTSLIQRHFRVGYNRAARLIDMMESHGIVSEAKGSKPRDVLISVKELQELQETSTII